MAWLLRALALATVLALSAVRGGQAEEVRGFTVEEARFMGMAAIEAGRPDVAASIAMQMLQRDPNDPFARFLLARAYLEAGHPKEARVEAKLAYRIADSPEQRHQSARLVAQAAWNEGRLGVAQRWLRRAAVAAPAPDSRAERVRELEAVRAANPWDVTLFFAINPSNNVNDGSSSAYNVIDGVPVVGTISPDGQALGGTVTQVRTGFSYRLPGEGQMEVGATLDWRRVDLSDSALARVPGIDPRAFDSGRLEVNLGRGWTSEGAAWQAAADIAAGVQIDGQEMRYRYLRLDAAWMRGFGDSTGFDVSFGAERRSTQEGQIRPELVGSLSFGLRRVLPGDDLLSTRFYVSGTETPIYGRSSRTWGFEVAYEPGRQIGPATVILRAGYSESAFPGYRVGFIDVPGGRKDQSLTAAATLTFPGISFQGFSPRMTITHTSTKSNVSRFESSKGGVTLGLTASF